LIFNQQPVTYIGNALRQFQFSFTVEDVGPADLYLEEQTLEVMNAAGVNIPVAVTYDELTNQIFLALPASFPRDGSVDGEYTVKISLVDKAGNRSDSEYTVVYDSKAPRLDSVMVNTDPPMELVPNRIAEIVESINSITLQFEEATRINFANTQITLMGPESTNTSGESTTPSIPLTLEDDGVSQITLNFLDLEQIGTYTLSVTPQDVAGNAAAGAVAYRFILDIPLPQVSSVVIGETVAETSSDVVYVNASNMRIGALLLDPTEIGLSLGSEGSVITVTEPDGTTVVPGAMGSNGEDLIVWEPITLTSDGTTDGRYNVYVTPIDKAGRQGSTVYREFIYDTQEPEIIAAGPINLSQPVTYISQSLTQFNFTVADIGPADLELSNQTVSLRDAGGSLVPAQLTNDTENQLFLTVDQPFPLDGSMDGEYTLLVELIDKAGNPYTVEHLIVYDTQAPTLVSTVPADGDLLTEDVTQIQVKLNDEGGSGIDWTGTTVTLINPNGTEISGELVSDGETALTLTTRQLIEDGRYVIRVQAVDRAGNGDATDFRQSFILSRRLPTIVSTEPITAPVDEAFMNEALERIEVTLEAGDAHDIGRHLSTLRLLNPTTQVVAGQLERTNDQLIYNLVRPLATDGSEDGVYTIEFTPISASGRAGQLQRLTFTYDTQAPEIESDEVINLVVAQPEVNNSLTEIHVNLTDQTSGIDWDNLDEEWLTFERLSPNPAKISGRISDDGEDNLTFRLTVPLADNGSADGEYRITLTPKDRAGNDDKPYEKVFIYDTSPPMIDPGTLLINEAPLLVDINAENYPTAVSTTGGVVIQANIFDTGLGVNLAQSKIVVRSPDGSEISGSTQQNGVDTLVFKSDGLTVQGVYKVTVISIGNDSELLGFAPTDSLTTEFLYETTVPTATLTSDGGETELTDKALPLEGTATDPSGTQRIGQDEMTVPASGVWLVEIVGIGPDKQPIDPVPVVDDSDAEQEPWSVWSIDFLPTRSGEYDLDVRVTDNAGNYEVYDIGEYTMSVSLTFRGTTFGWPNPLRLSKRDVAFFSFDVNVPRGDTIELTLSIYDWSGDMILSQTYPDVVSGQRNDQLVKWNLENQAGTPVARGLYIFRLEAVNSAGNRANVVGKVLVVE
jgi:methionine-rich copper-binding protein CopC